jgi:hypothetical protein
MANGARQGREMGLRDRTGGIVGGAGGAGGIVDGGRGADQEDDEEEEKESRESVVFAARHKYECGCINLENYFSSVSYSRSYIIQHSSRLGNCNLSIRFTEYITNKNKKRTQRQFYHYIIS